MSLPMPAHERFYRGTEWDIAAGPENFIGCRVLITGEVYEKDDELWVRVMTRTTCEEFEACLSWLS